MAGAVMIYVLPMLLGQTYDLGKDKLGVQIYPVNIADNAVKIEHYLTDSQYRMVENAEEMRDFLDVSGKLSLRIKSGLVDIGGEGHYLKDSSSKSNGLEILIKLHFETVTFTIPSSKKPNSDWATLSDQYLGTHYCRSITYGGDLLASIRISGSDQFDLEKIKGAVNGGVKTSGGSFEGDIKGKLELLKQNAEGSNSMEISYYASVPLHGVSYTIDGLMKLIEDFPDHVKKVNNGLGNPLKMELYPLSSLKEGFQPFVENRALIDELDDLESQFDDIRSARHQLGSWISQLPPDIPETAMQKISNFARKLDSVYGVYIKAIADLDVAQGASTQPVKDAFKAYKDNEYVLPQKFYRKFRSLEEEIYEEVPELRPKIGGAQYVRWGRSECNADDVEISVFGVATASEFSSSGGSSNFICSPLNPEQVNKADFLTSQNSTGPKLSPLQYNGAMKEFKSMSGKQVACAQCRSRSRSAVLVKMADSSCPKDWVKEYDGFLMSPSVNAKGEYICVDKTMKELEGDAGFGSQDSNTIQNLKEVTVICGSLPCELYEEKKPIECVVCTI